MIIVTTPSELFAASVAFMEAHGCLIERYETHCTVTFPIGTTREEIYPRTSESARFKLVLPDGCPMRQVWVRYLEQSVLYHPLICTQMKSASADAVVPDDVCMASLYEQGGRRS